MKGIITLTFFLVSFHTPAQQSAETESVEQMIFATMNAFKADLVHDETYIPPYKVSHLTRIQQLTSDSIRCYQHDSIRILRFRIVPDYFIFSLVYYPDNVQAKYHFEQLNQLCGDVNDLPRDRKSDYINLRKRYTGYQVYDNCLLIAKDRAFSDYKKRFYKDILALTNHSESCWARHRP